MRKNKTGGRKQFPQTTYHSEMMINDEGKKMPNPLAGRTKTIYHRLSTTHSPKK